MLGTLATNREQERVTMSGQLFILGAKDPEMDRIEQLLTENDKQFVHATKNFRRVNSGNAYTADETEEMRHAATLVFVECEVPDAPRDVVIDHHRPGDPGYDKGADDYFSASSIGQLYALLGIAEIPQSDRVLAATDHCFGSAMRGQCPGVSIDEVRALKEHNIASTLGISPKEVSAAVQYHLDKLRRFAYEIIEINGQIVAKVPYTGIGYTLDYLAAQVAAVLINAAVLIELRTEFEDEPLRYHLCGEAGIGTVWEFMEKWAPEHGLERIYGVPARGYAGGYVKQ